MKRIALALALGLVGCAHLETSSAELGRQQPFQLISVGQAGAYLIDPRSESCFFVYQQMMMQKVSCAKLKKNLPEAAKAITWESAPAPVEQN
jgi:hypothetical protein